MLLRAGADVAAKNVNGYTALLLAALQGHEGVVSILVEAGADLSCKDTDGNTALDVAVERGHAGVARVLRDAAAAQAASAPAGAAEGPVGASSGVAEGPVGASSAQAGSAGPPRERWTGPVGAPDKRSRDKRLAADGGTRLHEAERERMAEALRHQRQQDLREGGAGHADAEARRSVLTALPSATLVTVPTGVDGRIKAGAQDKRLRLHEAERERNVEALCRAAAGSDAEEVPKP